MERLIRNLLQWLLGELDARVLLSELDETYCRKVAVEGRSAARRWRRSELRRSLFHATTSRPRGVSSQRNVSARCGFVGSLIQDLRFTLRSFGRKPAFFSVVLALFALGIGANTVIFSIVDTVVLRPLPYVESGRLVTAYQTLPDWLESDNPNLRAAWNRLPLSFPVYDDWLEQNTVFDALGIYCNETFMVTGGNKPEWIRGTSVTHGVFAALRTQPLLGRFFLPGDDEIGGPPLVVLRHGFWQRRFGSDSSVVGRTLVLDESPHTIVGVMPQGFYFPGDGELWATFTDDERQRGRYSQFTASIARLKPNITFEAAQAEMDRLAEQLSEANPRPDYPGRTYGARLVPRKEVVVGNVRPALLLLLGAVGLVLLISCVNIANLLLVKTAERRRELAVRASIGAGRWRLLRQLLTESLTLSVAGGTLGTLVAIVSTGPFAALLPSGTPRIGEITVDVRLLTFAAGLSVLTGAIVGPLPSLAILRTPLNAVLQDSSRGTAGGRRRNKTQATLLVFEVALTFVLLVGAGLLTRSFFRLTSVEHGFLEERVVTLQLDLRGSRYASEDMIETTYSSLLESLASIPGVTSVAAAVHLPFMGNWSNSATVETTSGEVETNVAINAVEPAYFAVMGIPFVAGRTFNAEDRAGDSYGVVVSEGLARTYWPNENALGKRVKFGRMNSDAPWTTVVGVVGDVRRSLEAVPYPMLYGSVSGRFSRRLILLRTSVPPETVFTAARNVVSAVDPNLPILELNTLEERMGKSVAGPRVRSLLMSCLAGVAAVLAVVGIFGVLAYAVAQRTNEIGIRMALGAASTDVVRGVVNRGLVLLGLGVGIGLVVSLLAARALERFLFEVEPVDPVTLISVTLLLGVAAMAASYLPARRAARVDPVEALRRE